MYWQLTGVLEGDDRVWESPREAVAMKQMRAEEGVVGSGSGDRENVVIGTVRVVLLVANLSTYCEFVCDLGQGC